MNKATTATSMPIKNRPALTPSITPNKGSAIIQRETTDPGGHISANVPVRELEALPPQEHNYEEEFK